MKPSAGFLALISLAAGLSLAPVSVLADREGGSTGTRGGGDGLELATEPELRKLLEEVGQDLSRGRVMNELRFTAEDLRNLGKIEFELSGKVRVEHVKGDWIAIGVPRELPKDYFQFEGKGLKPNRIVIDRKRFAALETRAERKALILLALIDLRKEQSLASNSVVREGFRTLMLKSFSRLRGMDPEWQGKFQEAAKPRGFAKARTALSVGDYRLDLSTLRVGDVRIDLEFVKIEVTDRELKLKEQGEDRVKTVIFDRDRERISQFEVSRHRLIGIESENLRLALAFHELLRHFGVDDEGYPLSRLFYQKLENRPDADLMAELEGKAPKAASTPIGDLTREGVAEGFAKAERPMSQFTVSDWVGHWKLILEARADGASATYRTSGISEEEAQATLPVPPNFKIELVAQNRKGERVTGTMLLPWSESGAKGEWSQIWFVLGEGYRFEQRTQIGVATYLCRMTFSGTRYLVCSISMNDKPLVYRAYSPTFVTLTSNGPSLEIPLPYCKIFNASVGYGDGSWVKVYALQIRHRELKASRSKDIILSWAKRATDTGWCRGTVECGTGLYSPNDPCASG